MKRTKTPTIDAKDKKLQRMVDALGPKAVQELHNAYVLTARAIYRIAKKKAEAQLQEKTQSDLADQYRG